VALVLLL
jgi:hypothetical protein